MKYAAATAGEVTAPIFILCGARSGSTLLRYLLDSHPAISCPAETNLSAVVEGLAHLAAVVTAGPQSTQALTQEKTMALTAAIVEGTLEKHARDEGKARWADKSLTSIMHAPLLAEIFPTAQFICLHREFYDFAASALDASPFGFAAYGLDPYVRQSPDNLVRALLMYWLDRTSSALEFEKQWPTRTYRLRYEDLVGRPHAALANLARFLSVEVTGAFAEPEQALSSAHTPGPADHKIRHMSEITAKSVGQGWRIPRNLLPAGLKDRLSELATELGYFTTQFGEAACQPNDVTGIEGDPSNLATTDDYDLFACLTKKLEVVCAGSDASSLELSTLRFEIILVSENCAKQRVRLGCADTAEGASEPTFALLADVAALERLARGEDSIGGMLRHQYIQPVAPPSWNSIAIEDVLDAFSQVLRDDLMLRRLIKHAGRSLAPSPVLRA
jgi:hypothetical protein